MGLGSRRPHAERRHVQRVHGYLIAVRVVARWRGEVRTWDGWHRHITLAMLAHTFLAVMAWHTQPKMALVTLPWAPTRSGRTGASRLPVGAPSTAQQNRS
jgi:hypothetical protein